MELSRHKMLQLTVVLISAALLLHCHSTVHSENDTSDAQVQEVNQANQRFALIAPSLNTQSLSLVNSPKVKIYAGPRVVETGGYFHIVVTDQYGTEYDWTDLHIYVPGTYTIGVNASDLTPFYVQPGSVLHTYSNYFAYCTIEVRDDLSYDNQVTIMKNRYGKSAAWEAWMKSDEVKTRYESVWNTMRTMPTTISVAVEYGGNPLNYSPPWSNESEHMQRLKELAEKSLPGLDFDFRFGADPGDTLFWLKIGGLGGTSQNYPDYIYTYYETIFPHEWSHVIFLKHHYEGNDLNNLIHLPPGETLCIMARNHNQFCSACRAAMNLDLNADHSGEIEQITSDINGRYPY